MKTYILLGMLLLLGVSFAAETYNWMEYLINKYPCNYAYNKYGYIDGNYDMGLMEIAENYDDCDDPAYWDCEGMDIALEDMAAAVDGESEPDAMCTNSGCWSEGDYTNPVAFKASMLEYNAAMARFKAMFLAGYRSYLADGGSSSGPMLLMQQASADYQKCLNDLSDQPCWVCDE